MNVSMRTWVVAWVIAAVTASAFANAESAAAQGSSPVQRVGERGVRERLPPSTPLGSGPYPAIMEEAASLPMHTIYRPRDLAALADRKLPIVAWGNGGCVNNGSAFRWFLSEIASYGFLVIANGPIGQDPRSLPVPPPRLRMPNAAQLPPPATHTAQLIEAIDWAVAENGRAASALHNRVATDEIAVMGQSCGGVQAIEAARDPRVKTAVIWNSGLLPQPTAMGGGRVLDKSALAELHTPVAYVSGDAEDIAFANANDDFGRLKRIPALRAYERGVTHMGTYAESGGGEFGGVAVAWLSWQLKGDRRAGLMFTGRDCGLCVNPRWVIERKNIR
jgi:dienelactone hydrolase